MNAFDLPETKSFSSRFGLTGRHMCTYLENGTSALEDLKQSFFEFFTSKYVSFRLWALLLIEMLAVLRRMSRLNRNFDIRAWIIVYY